MAAAGLILILFQQLQILLRLLFQHFLTEPLLLLFTFRTEAWTGKESTLYAHAHFLFLVLCGNFTVSPLGRVYVLQDFAWILRCHVNAQAYVQYDV